MTIRVLLVDDHTVVLEGLAVLLGGFDSIEVVGTANGGAEAVARYGDLAPDVVLMDVSMPEVDGAEATRRIIAADPDARVLALSAFVDDESTAEVIDAGARGYLLKRVGGRELVDAITTIAVGGSILSPDALRSLADRRARPQLGEDLTPRELDVLRLVALGMTNQQIADELGLRHGTVRINVSNILTKLHAENRTSAAYIARTHKLVPDPA